MAKMGKIAHKKSATKTQINRCCFMRMWGITLNHPTSDSTLRCRTWVMRMGAAATQDITATRRRRRKRHPKTNAEDVSAYLATLLPLTCS